MVGVWYYQTDGPEVPSWSMVQNSFFQTGDDCIKLYWSHATFALIGKCSLSSRLHVTG